jgi:hypothetical protein
MLLLTRGLLAGTCFLAALVVAKDDAGLHAIQALIGPADCSADGQCRVIGVGARACGGPEAYLAWSSLQTSEKALRALVLADAEAKRLELERSGQLSDCRVLSVPVARCERPAPGRALGRCRLETAPGLR